MITPLSPCVTDDESKVLETTTTTTTNKQKLDENPSQPPPSPPTPTPLVSPDMIQKIEDTKRVEEQVKAEINNSGGPLGASYSEYLKDIDQAKHMMEETQKMLDEERMMNIADLEGLMVITDRTWNLKKKKDLCLDGVDHNDDVDDNFTNVLQ